MIRSLDNQGGNIFVTSINNTTYANTTVYAKYVTQQHNILDIVVLVGGIDILARRGSSTVVREMHTKKTSETARSSTITNTGI